MGLDQFAFKNERNDEKEFYWRKHSKLQTWMEQLFAGRTGEGPDVFNCTDFELTLSDIERLEAAIRDDELPVCEGGFFYGHQWQDEAAAEYREQDLEFCAWARQAIKDGDKVYYHCWW